jgi:hypothetical protein
MFVSDERVPVTCDESPGNTIYIRRDITDDEQSRLTGMAMAVKNGVDGAAEFGPAYEAFRHALKHTFVVGWEGPAFSAHPFTPANLDKLSAFDPLNKRVNDACMQAFQGVNGGPKAT